MPCIRVTASFCRQTRIHPVAGSCSTHVRAFLLPYLGNWYLLSWLICPQNPPVQSWSRACEKGRQHWGSCWDLLLRLSGSAPHTQMPQGWAQGCHPWATSHPGVELLLSPQSRQSWFCPEFLLPFCWKSSYLFRCWSLSIKDSSFSLCPLPSSQLCSRPGFDLSMMLWAAFTVWSQLEDGLPKARIHRWLLAQIVWHKKPPQHKIRK